MNFHPSLKLKALLRFHVIFEYCYSNRGGCTHWVLEGQTFNVAFLNSLQEYELFDTKHIQEVYVGGEMRHYVEIEHLLKYRKWEHRGWSSESDTACTRHLCRLLAKANQAGSASPGHRRSSYSIYCLLVFQSCWLMLSLTLWHWNFLQLFWVLDKLIHMDTLQTGLCFLALYPGIHSSLLVVYSLWILPQIPLDMF